MYRILLVSIPPSLLRHPSFSLELYNRFFQNAINASLPNDSFYDNVQSDMDIDTDTNTDNNVMAGKCSLFWPSCCTQRRWRGYAHKRAAMYVSHATSASVEQ